MIDPIDIFIAGHPAPQGSKRYVGRGIMIESSKKVKPWREDIRSALNREGVPIARLSGATICKLEFVLPRPKSTPKRTTPDATKKPDLDKLQRAVLDAATSAGVIDDDSQIVEINASKRLAEIGETAGLRLRLAQKEQVTCHL